MKVSAVLITRNQEGNAGRLITSVLDGMRALDGEAEVLLVDSASTDRTVDIAAAFPIRIIELADDQPLCASLGRYTGFENTTGEYVLFLDGDMELVPGWLQEAIGVLDESPDVAAVTGRRLDVPPDAGPNLELVRPHRTGSADGPVDRVDIRQGGGAAVYRRSALDEVGPFNPRLYSEEEPELCLRLRHIGGYRILRLDMTHVYHYSETRDHLSTMVGRARRRLYVGMGQIIRLHWRDPILKRYLRERGFALLPGAALFLALVAIGYYLATRDATWMAIWLGAALIALTFDAMRKRSLRQTLLSVVRRTLIMAGTVRGLLMPTARPDDRPPTFTVIR